MQGNKEFHSLSVQDSLKASGSSKAGLTGKEAFKRFDKNFLNELPKKEPRTAVTIFLSQFKSPFVLVLIAATLIAAFLGEATNAILIFIMLFLSAVLGFFQEFKSEKAIRALARLISFNAIVLRDNKETEVNATELVKGDIVLLSIGKMVPADLRLIECENLAINESILTGESEPAEKKASPLQARHLVMHQMHDMAFMGTTVSQGNGRGIVIAIGNDTQIARIAKLLKEKPLQTAFEKNMQSFGSFLLKIIVLMTVFVFIANSILHQDIFGSLLFALAFAVGITPELLPAIISISLAVGAVYLAKKHVVVKKLASIEDLGNVDVLCTDKTGTLTENTLFIHKSFDSSFHESPETVFHALLASDAAERNNKFHGSPIDVTIYSQAARQGLLSKLKDFTRLHEIEFDFSRKRVSYVLKHDNKNFLYCKGAADSVLPVCSKISLKGKTSRLSGKNKKIILGKLNDFSRKGYRLIAIARKEVKPKKSFTLKDEKDLEFLGFIALFDPPKKTAVHSLKDLNELKIELKILTGDNALVTEQVCNEVGFQLKGRIVLGNEIDEASDEKLRNLVEQSNVFCRLTPEHKVRIVNALTANKHITGFLGDGINDAPALKASDVGISVDSGADIAKDSADIVLLTHGLHVIVDGIREGRKTFANMIKYIFTTLNSNFGNMTTIALASIFLPFIPLLPVQIILLNLISDLPLLTISTDNVDAASLKKPEKWSIKEITHVMIFFGLISTVFDFITISVLIYVLQAPVELFRTGWFLESVLTELAVIYAIRTHKPFYKSKPSKLLVLATIFSLLLTLGIIYSPVRHWFAFTILPYWFVGLVIGIVIIYFLLIEAVKRVYFTRFSTQA